MTTVDLIKAGYRQSKDGFIISFVLHPHDDHSKLANADIGSQWQATFTALDEDGNPDPGVGLPPGREAGGPAKRAEPASRLTQLAGIACNDKLFQKYLAVHGYHNIDNRDDAADAVRKICGVKSRKEFIVGTPAGNEWLELYDAFALWRDAP